MKVGDIWSDEDGNEMEVVVIKEKDDGGKSIVSHSTGD